MSGYSRPSRAKPGAATSRGSAGGRARAEQQQRGSEVPPPPRVPLRLTVVATGHMVPTHGATRDTYASGDRDDGCAHYARCLDAHLAAHHRNAPSRVESDDGAEVPASCPRAPGDGSLPGSGCGWREAAPATRATDYMAAR